MADEPSVRRRKPEPKSATPATVETEDDEPETPPPPKPKKKSPKKRLDDDESYSTASLCLDVLRVLTFLFLASCGVSYLVSNGESFFWGMSNPPKYLRADWWAKQMVRLPSLPFPMLPAHDD
jgi:hypothetical protein